MNNMNRSLLSTNGAGKKKFWLFAVAFIIQRSGIFCPILIDNHLVRDVYKNISNKLEIDSLKTNPKYPSNPDSLEFIESFGCPNISAIQYGQKIYGWIQVAKTGPYGFYSTCKSVCELYLSLDEDPANKSRIINQKISSIQSTWTQYPGDRDPKSIYLKSNSKYYIEVLMTGDSDDDHLSIGAQLLGSQFSVISKTWLSDIKIVICAPDSNCDINKYDICINEEAYIVICTCKSGYEYTKSSFYCTDVNECDYLCKGDDLKCNNLKGSFQCVCPDGFSYNYTSLQCEVINECLIYCSKKSDDDDDSDKNNGFCKQLNGKYKCTCSVGYFFNYTSAKCQVARLVQEIYLGYSNEYNLNYPQFPDYYNILSNFYIQSSISYIYGQRIRGWLQVKLSGNYTFYSSCKDACQFYISTDNDPSKKWVLINQTHSSIDYNWNQYPDEQISDKISLLINKRYYIEAVLIGNDFGHIAIGLKLNGENNNPALLVSSQLSSIRISSSDFQPYYNEMCISENSTYALCTCQNGFDYNKENLRCSDIDECKNGINDCDWLNSKCINFIGNYSCLCQDGWQLVEGQKYCEDVNECIYLCKGDNLTCNNLDGSYICICPVGYSYNYKNLQCDDVNECAYLCKGEDFKCNNLIGSYTCDCLFGFTFNYTSLKCDDINECSYMCKANNHTCINMRGSYQCICPVEFLFNSTSLPCDEVNKCRYLCESNNLICNNLNGFQCVCPLGFFFNYTSLQCDDINECAYLCIGDDLKCNNLKGLYSCVCPVGFIYNYASRQCEDVDECMFLCKDDNTCTNLNGSYQCNCPDGFLFNYTTLQCDEFIFGRNSISIYIQENVLHGKNIETVFTIVNGTKLKIELDFGDDAPPILKMFTPNIFDPSSVNLTFLYKYSKCGKYCITVQVINLSSKNRNSTSSVYLTNVTVYCNLSEIKLDFNSSSQLPISVNEEFRLNISQASGSYVNYTVNWGDGVSEFNDQTQNIILFPFFVTHIYTIEGNYTVSVVAKNTVQAINKTIILSVLKTSQEIDFNYGTKYKPITILQVVDYNFTANISKSLDKSIVENASFQWILSGMGLYIKLSATPLNDQVVYTLKSYELAIGLYNLSLQFTYNNLTSICTAFFYVIKIPLFVEIKDGFYRTVAHKKILGNSTAYNNFTISAETSYDPENPEANLEGISFQWRCKINHFSSSILASTGGTDIPYISKLCINESYDLLDVGGPIVSFNTKMFILGITYIFEVYATKGAGHYQQSGSFTQEIMFSENVFDVQYICVVNCDKRINFQQPTIFSYNCTGCDRCIIQSYWRVLDDDGDWPHELYQNNAKTNFNDTSLIIKADTLLESKNYTFILQVGCNDSFILSTFKIKKLTCSLPSPGFCYISPRIGYAVKTRFNVTCEGWSDAEEGWSDAQVSLSYLFFYDNGRLKLPNSDYILLNSKTSHQSYLNNILFGTGDENNNYTVKFNVRVAGRYGAFVEYNDISIQVLPNLQEMNLSNILSTVDKNDTQKLMILIPALASVINKKEYLLKYQPLRNEMIEMLAQIKFSNMNDVKLVSDCLSTLSSYPSEVVPNAQIIAAGIASNVGRFLGEVNKKSLNLLSFVNTTQSLLQFVSNIFLANVNDVRENDAQNSLDSIANENQSRISADVTSKLLGFMEDYFYALQTYKASGEVATIGSTAAFDFFIKKELKDNLSNMPVSSGFILSDTREMFNNSIKNIPILVNNLRLKNQPFSWDADRSKNIATELQSLSMSTTERLPIEVNNLQQPIIISILNKPEKIKGYNLSLSVPEDLKMLSLVLTSNLCNMMLKFSAHNDADNLTFLIIFIQFGKVPTKNDFDIKLNISNKDGVFLIKNKLFKSSNASEELLFGQNKNLTHEIKNSSLFTERYQQARLLSDGTLILWDFQNSTYAFLNNSVLYISFSYVGPMPVKRLDTNFYTYDEKEYEGEFIYEMKSYCSECNYWNGKENKWMSNGCQLDFETTSFEVTKCKCKHLTGFGGFYVAPNVIQKPSLALLKKGYLLLVVVTVIILIWICGLIFARRMDIKDNTKYGVCPLPDNSPDDNYLYQITVNTGDRIHAGTTSKIYFILSGDIAETKTHRLKDSERQCFQRSASDSFILTTPTCLGDLSYIRLWHDNKGGGWYLRNIEVLDLQTDKRFYFMAKCWISIDKGDCLLDVTIPVSGSEELTHFNYLFTTRVRKDFFEKHLWFSIFTRPPRSIFNRCERLSVAVLLVVVQMTASTMFYGKVSNDPVNNNKVLGINFSWQQIYVALVSASITAPVDILFVHVFHLINPYYKFALKKTDLDSNTSSLSNENNIMTEIKKKKDFYLPYWAKYVTWFLCVIAILTCSCVVLLYGMSFGNKKSLDWFVSVILSMVNDVFVMQPMKIFIIAMITALALKKIDDKQKYFADDQAKVLAHNENWLHNFHKRLSIFERVELDTSPPDKLLLKSMKESQLHKLKLHTILRELLFYFIFALLVFYLAYSSRDSFMQTNNIEFLFNLKSDASSTKQYHVLEQLRSKNDFWLWLDTFFFPQVFPQPWYNMSSNNKDGKIFINDLNSKIFINDLNSKIINGIRIRQARVKPYSCLKASLVADLFTLECLSEFKTSLEETQDFDFEWSLPKTYSISINQSTKPWRYQTSKELDGYPLGAKLQTYFGGGYVIEIFPKWNNKKIIENAKKHTWIDRQTRAVFIEFALFNAATNNFNMVTFVFEFPASGGLIPSYSVDTFKLYPLKNNVFIIACQLLFCVMMCIFAIREFRMMRRTGWKYFKGLWNLAELMLIVLSILAVVFFFYRGKLAKDLLNRLPAKEPQKFINFQFALYWDLMFTYIVSLIVFIVNIKFMKILNFNPRVSMMSATLKASSHYLVVLAITLLVIMSAMVCFSNIAFGAVLNGYVNYFETVVSLMSLVLGKFDFNQLQSSCGYFGPLLLFTFNIWMNWIMMSLFISILNNGFSIVRRNAALQKDKYNILSFFESRIKGLLGFGRKKSFVFVNKDCKENLKSVRFNLDVDTDLTSSSMDNIESLSSSLDDKLAKLNCLMQRFYDEAEVLILPLFSTELFSGDFMEAFSLKMVIDEEILEYNQLNKETEDF